jgi:uncharacterized surface protein with fasciclin (FAS1) repeats
VLTPGASLPTLNTVGGNLTVGGTVGAPTVNNITAGPVSIACTNGNVFLLNTSPLVPSNNNIPTTDILTIAAGVPTLSSLVAALNATGLLPALAPASGPFTVFAPLNTAFARLPAGLLTGVTLSGALQYHVVPGRFYASQVAGLTTLTTLLAAVTAAGLAPTFSNVATRNAFTLFAPTNAAFAAVPANTLSWLTANRAANIAGLTNVLTYHVINSGAVYSRSLTNGQALTSLNAGASPQLTVTIAGATVSVNGATVVSADNAAYNGVAHVINAVLVPSNAGIPTQDITTTATNTAVLSTLVSALTSAGLVPALSNPNGPFTVFAPTNAAFARLPSLAPSAATTAILQAHVVPGRIYASQLTNQTLATLNSAYSLRIVVLPGGGGVQIWSPTGAVLATVTTADAADCSNGVVHIIDAVLDAPTPTSGASAGAALAATAAAVAAAAVVTAARA